VSRKTRIRTSRDGAYNYGDFREASLGEVGEYRKRVRFTRLGMGRQFVLYECVTDPIRADLLEAVVDFEVQG
jgi:hypothetical protein